MKAPAKIYTPSSIQRRNKLLPVFVVLVLILPFLQHIIDPTRIEIHKGDKSIEKIGGGLNNEFLLLPLLGFREAAAGLLWVRCDEFFHSGDYDAILPLVRLITWLDPHADNVYVTGAWHLSYNFTDSSERSDRRYIPPSQKLLDEGIENNMNIPDIKFEKGWENYDKIKNFPEAVKAFQMALEGPNKDYKGVPGTDDYPYAAPLRIWHTLAHSYAKEGRITDALTTWQKALERSRKMMAEPGKDKDFSLKSLNTAELRNYNETLQRYHDRFTTTGHSPVNPTPYPAVLQPGQGGKTPQPWNASLKPLDGKAGFVEITSPKVFKVSGLFNVADGARVDVRISDEDYKPRDVSTTINSFEVPSDQTILLDALSVRKTKFERELDMSKDPKMYNFTAPWYKIVLSYNTRTSSPHLQDRFGWSGEGITDENKAHVILDRTVMGNKLIDGQDGEGPVWDGKDESWRQYGQPARIIKVTYRVSRETILKGGVTLTDKDIVPNE